MLLFFYCIVFFYNVNYKYFGGKIMTDGNVEKMKEIIAEQLSVDPDKVILNASFVDDLGADSLDLVELILAIEEGFDVEVPDEDAENIVKVQDAIDYVDNFKV